MISIELNQRNVVVTYNANLTSIESRTNITDFF